MLQKKKIKVIHDLVKGEGGADEWRTLGLEAANKVKKTNDKGIKHLKPMVWLFAIGLVLAAIGITFATMGTAGIAIPAAVGLAVAATGITGTAHCYRFHRQFNVQPTKSKLQIFAGS